MMRLTLRTLLAYLDDLLEPAQAKELGAKIQESEKAAELIMRIRDVIRKRRLTAPVVNGPGCDLDANLVAEYLDNTLPPEGVADLEKICLDSDTHLAEVAACHQILTLVLGEPVDIGSHSRERMYALGQAAAQMGAAAAAEHSAEPESVTGNRGKPTAPMITPATVGLNRKAIHDLDQPRRSDSLRGDSFIGKGQATAGHPSASLPGRPVPAVGTGGTNGQRAGHSGILSAPEHAAAAPQSMSKSTIISNASSLSGLGPAVKSVSAPRPASATTPASDASANPARNQSTTEPFDRTIPDYLKQPPLWKRALPVAVLLLIAVWVGTLLKDKDLLSGLLGRRPESTADNQLATTNDAAATTAAKQGAGGPSGETPSQAAAVVQSDAAELQADADSEKPQSDVLPAKPKQTEVAVADPGVDAPPPLEAGDSTNQTKATAKAPVPKEPESPNKTTASKSTETEEAPANSKTATEVAIVDTPRPGGPGKTPAKTVKPAPAVPTGTDNRPQPVRYVSQEGVVLRFDDDRQGWFPLPHRQFVFAEDILAVPEPFDAQFQFGTEKHRLTALGPTLFQVIETMDDLPLAINVERGKILVQPAETAAGTMPARLKLSLNVQGQTWLLELPDANSRCGIEIIPREPNQFEENFGPQGWSGRLVVASGTVKVTTPEGKAQIITGPESYVLAPDPNATATPPVPSSIIPSWMGERKMSSVAKLNATQLQRTLLQDDLSAHDALLSAVADRVPEKSRLATACLGLVGDYQLMLEVLERNEHHESREAAISSLRTWINLNPVNRDKLKAELSARFFKDDVEIIYRLLWGYTEQDLRGKVVSRQLVNCLTHDNLAVRELACHHIKAITNRRLDFDARGPQAQRSSAIQQLEKVLDKDGSLLPPLPKGAAASVKRN